MKILFLCFCSLINLAYSKESKEFDAGFIKSIEISNPKGEILVTTSHSIKKILVSIEKVKFDKQCHFNLSSDLGIISAKVEQENALFEKSTCISKLKVEIPLEKLIDLEVSSGSSNIKLINLQGKIDFITATGSVAIIGDILKNIDGKTATSKVHISYKKCSTRADINLITATGDTEIQLPSDCKILVSHKSATGELFNELGENENYLIHINSRSAAGNLKIKKLKK